MFFDKYLPIYLIDIYRVNCNTPLLRRLSGIPASPHSRFLVILKALQISVPDTMQEEVSIHVRRMLR